MFNIDSFLFKVYSLMFNVDSFQFKVYSLT